MFMLLSCIHPMIKCPKSGTKPYISDFQNRVKSVLYLFTYCVLTFLKKPSSTLRKAFLHPMNAYSSTLWMRILTPYGYVFIAPKKASLRRLAPCLRRTYCANILIFSRLAKISINRKISSSDSLR